MCARRALTFQERNRGADVGRASGKGSDFREGSTFSANPVAAMSLRVSIWPKCVA